MLRSKKKYSQLYYFKIISIYIVIDLFLILIFNPGSFIYADIGKIFIPVKSYTSKISNNVSNFLFSLGNISSIETSNMKLQRENYKYKSEIININNLKNQNVLLKKQLYGKYLPSNYKYLYTEIMYYGTNNTLGYTYINSGKNEGVVKGDSLVFQNYLIGVVSSVSNYYSKVSLLSNINSNIPVLVNNVNGIITGSLSNSLVLNDITELNSISRGDVVLTSGLDGLPKDLIVGYVESVGSGNSNIFKKVFVDSAININSIKSAFIVIHE